MTTTAVPITLPEDFIREGPQSPDDLIGPARLICRGLLNKARRCKAEGKSLMVLLAGQPGNGKSTIAHVLAQALVDHPLNLVKLLGRQITYETAQDWLSDIRFGSVLPGYVVRWAEEIDTMPRNAQDVFILIHDDMPSQRAVIATSNLDFGQLDDRFRSRFQVEQVRSPSPEDISQFLLTRWPELPAGYVRDQIAPCAGGNVRAALNMAQSWFDAQ